MIRGAPQELFNKCPHKLCLSSGIPIGLEQDPIFLELRGPQRTHPTQNYNKERTHPAITLEILAPAPQILTEVSSCLQLCSLRLRELPGMELIVCTQRAVAGGQGKHSQLCSAWSAWMCPAVPGTH